MVTDNDVYDEDAVNHGIRPPALQAIFRRIDDWMGQYDLGRTSTTDTYAYYLPGARQVERAVAAVHYRNGDTPPAVELVVDADALAQVDLLDEFDAAWAQLVAATPSAGCSFERRRSGDYRVAFDDVGLPGAVQTLDALAPLMAALRKRKPRVL